jgi:LAS superfamily LD-carboxypeptidase LdcB
MALTELQRLLTGHGDEQMVQLEPGGARVHRDVAAALLALKDAARQAGFTLEVASGFRDFARQLSIWNRKARGELPLLDDEEHPLDAAAMAPVARMFAILRWSALPGASRHHWGTDADIFDRAAIPPKTAPLLRRSEALPGAVFGRFHLWLGTNLQRFGFFRPYVQDRGGVSPEPWHVSHAAVATALRSAYSLELLEQVLREADIELKAEVLRNLPEIYEEYVLNVERP